MPNRLDELKAICKDRKDTAFKLKQAIDQALIDRDLKLFLSKNKPDENSKPINSLEIRTTDLLEIIDRRGVAFLWCFEVEFDFVCRIGDAFIYNNKPFSVAHIDKADEKLLLEIEKVIAEYDSAISYLQTNRDVNTYAYYYYSAHEEVTCSDIFEVFDTVLARKP